jgi:hypothetical protein
MRSTVGQAIDSAALRALRGIRSSECTPSQGAPSCDTVDAHPRSKYRASSLVCSELLKSV